ncbi:MAG: sigma-70 family RNA polymerase sigma factor [Planctomycetes bacterium]|nr:sigma-70 family RNA polymerase sigma factor [Planctomycetota bacterium]
MEQVALTREHERQLIQRVRKSDKAALRELIDQHKDRLFAFIWRMVRDHHEAEDICQDAFLKAFASLDTFSCDFRFSTWLFTIGYRVCLNRLRRRKSAPSATDNLVLPATSEADATSRLESEDAAMLRGAVWSAVDRLSPPQRAVVLLFYKSAMGCQEISEILQLPSATVKSHLHRARTKLREFLEPIAGQEFENNRNQRQEAV